MYVHACGCVFSHMCSLFVCFEEKDHECRYLRTECIEVASGENTVRKAANKGITVPCNQMLTIFFYLYFLC